MYPEADRLLAVYDTQTPWQKWGPYLSERQRATVREDYSSDGNAWEHFGHDQARSRAYHWGEERLAGISDDRQQLCFALALWNGLKERLSGLTKQWYQMVNADIVSIQEISQRLARIFLRDAPGRRTVYGGQGI